MFRRRERERERERKRVSEREREREGWQTQLLIKASMLKALPSQDHPQEGFTF